MMTQSGSKMVAGKAGKFTVYNDGSFTGPAGYVEQVNLDKIVSSVKILSAAAPAGITALQLVAVALQTDYAAWLGQQEAKRWMKGGA